MTDNEKTVLEKLCDELRTELSTTQLNCNMWHDRAEDMRSRLSAAQADNAKLRNEVDNLMDFEHLTSVAVAYAGCDECGEYKQTMLRLFAENAKLRELVSDMLPFAEVGMDDTCVTRRCCLYEQCEDVVGGPCIIEGHMLDRMRELGIDVPNG